MHRALVTRLILPVALLAACSTEFPSPATGTEAPTPPKLAAHEEPAAAAPASIVVYASVDEDFGQTPHTVKLTAEVKPGTGRPPFTYIWDFGDATEFSREPSVKHVYADSGSYRASVKVVDANGDKDQDYVDLWILPPVSDEQLRDAMAAVQQLKMPSAEEMQADLQRRLKESLVAAPGASGDGAPASR